MYTTQNFKTKKALKEAVSSGERITVYQPNALPGVTVPTNGSVTLEGPWYPAAHTWYATAILRDGAVVSVK